MKPKQVLKRHIQASISVSTPIIMDELPVCGPGFTGRQSKEIGGAEIPLEEQSLDNIFRFGFRVQEWDGM